MIDNNELKKKIAQIIAERCCPLGKAHKQLYGDDRQCYSKMNFAECERVVECVNALIAAGLRFGENLTATFDHMALEREHELERRLAEVEHRAEVAEKAGRIIQRDMARVFDISNPRVCELIANIWDLAKKQAEKELAEEGKDEQMR